MGQSCRRRLVLLMKQHSVTFLHVIIQACLNYCDVRLPLWFVLPVKDRISPSLSHTLTNSLHSWACMTWSWYFKQFATPPPGQFNDPVNVLAGGLVDIRAPDRKYSHHPPFSQISHNIFRLQLLASQ